MTNKVLSNESKQENKNKEIIIKLLLGNSNEISFSKKDCKNLNIPEFDVTRIIYRLQ